MDAKRSYTMNILHITDLHFGIDRSITERDERHLACRKQRHYRPICLGITACFRSKRPTCLQQKFCQRCNRAGSCGVRSSSLQHFLALISSSAHRAPFLILRSRAGARLWQTQSRRWALGIHFISIFTIEPALPAGSDNMRVSFSGHVNVLGPPSLDGRAMGTGLGRMKVKMQPISLMGERESSPRSNRKSYPQ
jgi:hypothetical protein